MREKNILLDENYFKQLLLDMGLNTREALESCLYLKIMHSNDLNLIISKKSQMPDGLKPYIALHILGIEIYLYVDFLSSSDDLLIPESCA